MKIVIDCRFVHHSGIGSYIRALVPRLLAVCAEDVFVLILSPAEYDEAFVARCRRAHVSFLACAASMYSLQEQLVLPWKIPACDVFLAPHYNVPLLPIRAKRRYVTIHDAFHLHDQQHLPFLQRMYARLFFFAATHFSQRIFAVSQFTKAELMRWEHISGERISVVPNGIDTDFFHPVTDEERREEVRDRFQLPARFFLFVGNVKPHKNLRRLLLAYQSYAEESAHPPALVIVGKDAGFHTGEQHLRPIIEAAERVGQVIFTGRVRDADLPVLYSLAEAFVFPSLYEGFGLPPLEAMACGCPVACARAASLPEVCGDAALYFDPRDIGNMAQALARISGAPEVRERLRRLGKNRVKEFSWDRAAEQIAASLHETAER